MAEKKKTAKPKAKAKPEPKSEVEKDQPRESEGFIEPQPEAKPEATNQQLAERAHALRFQLKRAKKFNDARAQEQAENGLKDLIALHQRVFKNPCGENAEWTKAHQRTLEKVLAE